MSEMTEAVAGAAEPYSAAMLIGCMTVALMLALVLIGLAARFIRMLAAARDCDAALEKMKAIEDKLAEMTGAMREVERDYEKSLAGEKAAHDREVFSLQQVIFERNNEILTLRASLAELRQQAGYPYDMPPA
jgi:hypothetical protein